MDEPDVMHPSSRAARRRARTRRLIRILLVVDVALLVAAIAAFVSLRDGDERENAVNAGLRGSTPPAGQLLPDGSSIEGVSPAPPTLDELRGSASALVATCIDCRSGDILGGFLGRLGDEGLPGDARVLVYGWEGDVDAWAREWAVPSGVELLQVSPRAVDDAREVFGIRPVDGQEESGITFLADTEARWRATYFIGQLDAADIRHDLEVLGSD